MSTLVMSQYAPVVLAFAAIALSYFFLVLFTKRNELRNLPQPRMKNKLLGHLHIAAECAQLFPPNVHMQVWIRYIQKKYNLGEVFYIDWWPMGPRWLFISDPELINEHVVATQSLPKSRVVSDFVDEFLGVNNMLSLEGQRWKSLRSIFNPGFSSTHLMTMMPHILDATLVFYEVLRDRAVADQLIELEEYATKLTIDIISKVALDARFDSQKTSHPIVELFRERPLLMPYQAGTVNFSSLQLRRRYRLWQNGRELDRLIGEELDRKVASRGSGDASGSRSVKDRKRSIVDLAIESYYKEQPNGKTDPNKPTNSLSPEFRRDVVDSLKTFIFAGHDTTASTIAYAMYLVHFYPKVRKRVNEEVQFVFGDHKDPRAMLQVIKDDPRIINRLEYVTALIKETLRLYPPASTIRRAPDNANLFMADPKTGEKLPLKGFDIWAPPTFVGRNERFFPQPVDFIPERFIQSETPFPEAELFTPAGRDAWRPFEKGPRSCIGLELAMIEMKISVALVIPRLDFVAEFKGLKVQRWTPIETYDEYRDGLEGRFRMTVEGNPCYQVLRGAAKPREGMPGRVKILKF